MKRHNLSDKQRNANWSQMILLVENQKVFDHIDSGIFGEPKKPSLDKINPFAIFLIRDFLNFRYESPQIRYIYILEIHHSFILKAKFTYQLIQAFLLINRNKKPS